MVDKLRRQQNVALNYTETAYTQWLHLLQRQLTLKSVWISFVSNMYPSGIQLRNRNRVSSVDSTNAAFWEFSWQQQKGKKQFNTC